MISAIVFPQFVETCRDHIREQTALNEDDFETFEQLCLDQVRAHKLSSPSSHKKPSPARLAFRALPAKDRGCLEQDGLALVEYALMLQSTGCVLDLRGRHRQLELQDSRRQLQYLSQWLGASAPECDW